MVKECWRIMELSEEGRGVFALSASLPQSTKAEEKFDPRQIEADVDDSAAPLLTTNAKSAPLWSGELVF